MRVAVQPGRRDDVQSGRLRDGCEPVKVSAEADRRPVDERPGARGHQRSRFDDRLVELGELLSRLGRSDEEEMLVRVAGAELVRLDVAADGTNDHGPGSLVWYAAEKSGSAWRRKQPSFAPSSRSRVARAKLRSALLGKIRRARALTPVGAREVVGARPPRRNSCETPKVHGFSRASRLGALFASRRSITQDPAPVRSPP